MFSADKLTTNHFETDGPRDILFTVRQFASNVTVVLLKLLPIFAQYNECIFRLN